VTRMQPWELAMYFFEVWFLIELIFAFRLVDNLPCATKEVNLVTKEVKYRPGYPLGFMSQNEDGTRSAYINNHLKLILDYHSHTK